MEASRNTAFGRHYVELAVGPHEQTVLVLHEYNPLAVRGNLRKIVTHAILRSTENLLRFAPLPIVKSDAVQIVLNLSFIWVVRVFRWNLSRIIRVLGFGTRIDEVLAVGTPEGAGLNVVWI